MRRNLLTAGYGALAVGPFGHAWYIALDRVARMVFTPGSLAFVGGKVRAGAGWAGLGWDWGGRAATCCCLPPHSLPMPSPTRPPHLLALWPHCTAPLQVVADTAIFGPIHVCGYFAHMTLCEGGTLADVRAKLKTDFWPTFTAELTVWPPVQFANFKLVRWARGSAACQQRRLRCHVPAHVLAPAGPLPPSHPIRSTRRSQWSTSCWWSTC